MVISKDEKEWRADSDARTLMEAEKIKSDKSRSSAALSKVKSIIKDAENTVKTAKRISGGKSKKRTKRTEFYK